MAETQLYCPTAFYILEQTFSMKKLVAAYCCFLFIQSFSKITAGNEIAEQKAAGQKTLIKAIAVMVNSEANKKFPPRRIYIASAEPPVY